MARNWLDFHLLRYTTITQMSNNRFTVGLMQGRDNRLNLFGSVWLMSKSGQKRPVLIVTGNVCFTSNNGLFWFHQTSISLRVPRSGGPYLPSLRTMGSLPKRTMIRLVGFLIEAHYLADEIVRCMCAQGLHGYCRRLFQRKPIYPCGDRRNRDCRNRQARCCLENCTVS